MSAGHYNFSSLSGSWYCCDYYEQDFQCFYTSVALWDRPDGLQANTEDCNNTSRPSDMKQSVVILVNVIILAPVGENSGNSIPNMSAGEHVCRLISVCCSLVAL